MKNFLPFTFTGLVYLPDSLSVLILETDSTEADQLQIGFDNFGSVRRLLKNPEQIQSDRQLEVYEFTVFPANDKNDEITLSVNRVVLPYKTNHPLNFATQRLRLAKIDQIKKVRLSFDYQSTASHIVFTVFAKDEDRNIIAKDKAEHLKPAQLPDLLQFNFQNDLWTPRWSLRDTDHTPVDFDLDFSGIESYVSQNLVRTHFTPEVCYFVAGRMGIIKQIFQQ